MRDCQQPDGSWCASTRTSRGCKLPGLPPVPFVPTAALYQNVQGTHGSAYIGRYPSRRLAGTKYLGVTLSWKHPFEAPERGCPGAYYRTTYIDSLDPLMRARDANGGRVPNPLFDGAPWQVQRAVMILEGEEERAHAYALQIQHDRARAEAEAEEAARTRKGRGRGRRR